MGFGEACSTQHLQELRAGPGDQVMPSKTTLRGMVIDQPLCLGTHQALWLQTLAPSAICHPKGTRNLSF